MDMVIFKAAKIHLIPCVRLHTERMFLMSRSKRKKKHKFILLQGFV